MGPSNSMPVMPYPAFQISQYQVEALQMVVETKPVETTKDTGLTVVQDVSTSSEPTKAAVIEKMNEPAPVTETAAEAPPTKTGVETSPILGGDKQAARSLDMYA